MADDELFRTALGYHQAGDLEHAAEAYQQFLKLQPNHSQAIYFLGIIAYQTGNFAPCVQLMQRALATGADQAQCRNILGLAFTALGKFSEAEASFAAALAIRKTPDFYNNLGILLNKQGRFDEAIAAYRGALAEDPNFADGHYNAGNAHWAKHELQQATECFERAIKANPAHGHAIAALGQTLHALERNEEALTYFDQAIALFPGDADLHHELGNIWAELKRLPEALAEYQKALAIHPKLARVWYSAGCAENSRKEYVAAIACFEKALEIEPAWPEAMHNLGQAWFHLGQVERALAFMRQAAASDRPQLPRAMIALIIPGSPQSDNQAILDARVAFAERDLLPPGLRKLFSPRGKVHGERLRIGYISSFFHRPNWMKPVWGLMNQHDRSNFEIHLFSDAPAAAMTGYQPHPEDCFSDTTGLSNHEVASEIEQSEIDILVDLNGYSTMRRLPLFALRPAPVIAGWFNMYATTGMRSFDYLIGDSQVVPEAEEKFYCEKIVRVPGSYLTFDVSYPVPEVIGPPCLAKGVITFGCLASQYKITSEVVFAWSQILHQAPRSSLILKNSGLGPDATRQFVHELFRAQGIAPERVRLEGPSDHHDFLKAYNEIDVALDPFPYNGGTTTTEAIWQGVPVISYWGDRWAARTSASILRAGNLGEFVGSNLEEYISLAVRLANSPDTPRKLVDLRGTMRNRLLASSVCDTYTFARNMERLYREMRASK